MSHDSFQYLSAADQLRSTHRMATSLVHFDTERSHGTIPAPLTWFPPGYPAAIAVLSTIGFSYETAALWISLTSFALVTALLWLLMRMLDPSWWAARAAVLCWLANSHAAVYSVSAVTEPMFTAFGLASLLFLASTVETHEGTDNAIRWMGVAVLAGLSYWVRYAGILWVLTCFLLLIAQIAATRHNARPSQRSVAFVGASFFIFLIFLMPLMLRNIALTGDWRGAATTPLATPISTLAIHTPKLVYHLVLGDARLSQLWFPIVLVSIGVVGITVGGLRGKVDLSIPKLHLLSWQCVPLTKKGLVAAALLIYSSGIAAIAASSIISYTPRMYVPVLPHLIALLTCAVTFLIRRLAPGHISRPIAITAVLCLLLGYTAGNYVSRSSVGPDIYEKTTEALRRPDTSGLSIKQTLDQELTPGAVIAATNGQAAGYALKHPTLSLAGHPYTLMPWTASTLHLELVRFRATHLLVFRGADFDPIIEESPFLAALSAGQAPQWLQPAAFNQYVYVYRVQSTNYAAMAR